MKVGMIGLGKLGLPVAVAMEMRGAEVMGYDIDESRMSRDPQPYQEMGPVDGDFNNYLADSDVVFGDPEQVIRHTDGLVFVAVQTPHEKNYEGITPLPAIKKDFDYSYLKEAVTEIDTEAYEARKNITIVVISTCLPGTMQREIKPLLSDYTKLVYNPFFIAMGTTMRDFLNPEFILLGANDNELLYSVYEFYESIQIGPVEMMSIESAELTKVAYNTYISSKISFVSMLGEICHKIPGADVDEVTDALHKATERLISPKYLRCGMGDGGGCHPRDNIAMSWLAENLSLHFDYFDCLMRERQGWAEFLGRTLADAAHIHALPMAIYGTAFKAGTNLEIGSHALLVRKLLKQNGNEVMLFDPWVRFGEEPDKPYAFLIGCNHPGIENIRFPFGSVVIDPWRIIPDQQNVLVIRIGEAEKDLGDIPF